MIDKLLMVAKRYAKAKNITLSATSSRACGDHRRLPLLDEGRASMTVHRVENVLAWFSTNWPSNAEWPKSVKRKWNSNRLSA